MLHLVLYINKYELINYYRKENDSRFNIRNIYYIKYAFYYNSFKVIKHVYKNDIHFDKYFYFNWKWNTLSTHNNNDAFYCILSDKKYYDRYSISLRTLHSLLTYVVNNNIIIDMEIYKERCENIIMHCTSTRQRKLIKYLSTHAPKKFRLNIFYV